MIEPARSPPDTAPSDTAPSDTAPSDTAPPDTAPPGAAATSVSGKGTELPPLSLRVTRADLVRYAGASGDFNPIHWSDRVATGVGLPGVIAHGMLTMALAGRLVTQWAGSPAAMRRYAVRFTRPVVVPDDDEGAAVDVSGTVSAVAEAEDGTRIATVAITATFDGKTVLGRATAEVALPS